MPFWGLGECLGPHLGFTPWNMSTSAKGQHARLLGSVCRLLQVQAEGKMGLNKLTELGYNHEASFTFILKRYVTISFQTLSQDFSWNLASLCLNKRDQ